MTRPNHIPPGNAAPRFIDLRDGGLLPDDPRPVIHSLAFYAAVFAIGFMAGMIW